ncbi:MAG: flagellar biosynthesis anti-sigma factor FlgM [Fidelibacterota bacterium]|nr:MAG: flagellar biosynthesis anti-sigma factor FlgM [Candidatus Neomarinimicrobiota bacterium]
MAPIKNIVGDVPSPERLKPQDRVSTTRSDKAKKQGQARESATVESRGDTVNISTAARQLAETRDTQMAQYQDMLQALKSEDGDKVKNVQQRIAQGEFNEPAVLESVAEAISNLPQFQALTESAPETSRTRELRGDIAQRIRSGEYESDDVLDRVAINILRDIGAA